MKSAAVARIWMDLTDGLPSNFNDTGRLLRARALSCSPPSLDQEEILPFSHGRNISRMVGNCPTTTGEGRNSARKIEDSDTLRQKRAGRKSIVRSKVATAVGGLLGG